MTFISYAQNFEDIMLWRALQHVQQGFYIDVGANDPSRDSVTRAFYERGWRGINIEPMTQYYGKLMAERQRDINLQVLAASAPGELSLYEFPDTGLSTLDVEIAARHEVERGFQFTERRVPARTLTDICGEYHESPIHFLKIDVEGAERSVLEGLDLSRIRPWILVVESTVPNKQVENCSEWEELVLRADYEHVYFDGLNRFYVASEHKELGKSFSAPPNFFDNFLLSETHGFAAIPAAQAQQAREETAQQTKKLESVYKELEMVNARAAALENQLSEPERALQQAQLRLKKIEATLEEQRAQTHYWWAFADEQRAKAHDWWLKAEEFRQELDAVYCSKSWRITLPARQAVWFTKRFYDEPLRMTALCFKQPKRVARWSLTRLISIILRRPRLKVWVVDRVRKWPAMEAKLKQFAQARGLTGTTVTNESRERGSARRGGGANPCGVQAATVSLTPRGREIYEDLTSAVEQRRGNR